MESFKNVHFNLVLAVLYICMYTYIIYYYYYCFPSVWNVIISNYTHDYK